jgi:hypothetical protein
MSPVECGLITAPIPDIDPEAPHRPVKRGLTMRWDNQAGVRFARRFVLLVPLGVALVGLSVGNGRAAYAKPSWANSPRCRRSTMPTSAAAPAAPAANSPSTSRLVTPHRSPVATGPRPPRRGVRRTVDVAAVADATRGGSLSAVSARVVLLHAAGHSVPELARRAGTSRASVYRLCDCGHARLRDDLDIAS